MSEDKARLTPFEVLLDAERIARRVRELGEEITRDYAGESPVLICVLKGGAVFFADLVRAINLPIEVDFVSAASYRQGATPSEKLLVRDDTSIPLTGRHVLIVEGVVDSGRTAASLVRQVRQQEPASVALVTLIDKPACHRYDVDLKYKGFSLGNEFVIGYGLDNAQKYRNLPYIGRVIDE